MNAKSAVRDIMDRKGVSTKMMADILGSNMQKVCDRLGMGKSTNLSTDKLNEMIVPLGYKIVLMPADEEMKEDWYGID